MRFLLITTGGTILSENKGRGLLPAFTGKEVTDKMPSLKCFDFDISDLLAVDSTNMDPRFWSMIASAVRDKKDDYDGFLILHGSDTMAYTSSALSYILRDINKPVVLTGASLPAGVPGSDGEKNIYDSFSFLREMVLKKMNIVAVCFRGKLISGVRVEKSGIAGAIEFKSSNSSDLGFISDEGRYELGASPKIDREFLIKPECGSFSKEIMTIKLFPGFKTSYFSEILQMNPKAVVIESFGAGGLPNMVENFIPEIKKAVSKGIFVVMTTQVSGYTVDLSAYEVGRQALDAGAAGAYDMNFEAAITKLMWLFSFCTIKEAKIYFMHNFCDELKCL